MQQSKVADLTLERLARDIRELHNTAQSLDEQAINARKTAVAKAREAGLKLIEAKRIIGHGNWLLWLKENTNIPERTAQAYMRIAELPDDKYATVADLGLKQALQSLTHVTPSGRAHSTGSKSTPKAPARDKALEYIMPLVLARKPVNSRKIEAEIGVNHRTVEAAHAIARERVANYDAVRKALADAEAEGPKIDRKDLSMSAQQKFDAAIRQERKRIEANNEERIRAEVAKRFKYATEQRFPQMDEELRIARITQQRYEELTNKHRPVFSMDEFNTIRRCLHPDSHNAISRERLAEAFRLFEARKFVLTGQK